MQLIRPVRIAARRQRELMAVIAFNEFEDVKWLDDELVDPTGIAETIPDCLQQSIPVVDTAVRLATPWTDE